LAPINVFRVFILSFSCLLACATLHAQPSPAEPTNTKVGVINIQQAIVSSAEGKQAAADLQAQFLARQQELESLNKQVGDLQQRLNSDATLSDADRSRLNTQGTRLSQRLDRKNNEYQEDLREAQNEIMNRIGRKLMDVVNRYAQEHNFSVILDSSGTNSSLLLFAARNLDLTQDIIRLYDEANPAKGTGSVPASKPASTPKPATPPATKPQ
jgi:outer membrane protein